MKIKLPDYNKNTITHSRVHYLWAIDELSKTNEAVRAIDVAKFLGVSRSAVSVALAHLKKQKLVIEKTPYHILKLTNEGKKQLEKIDSNYSILVEFFKDFLNLDSEVAEKQACLIEHLLMEEVYLKLKQLFQTNTKFDHINLDKHKRKK